MADATQQGAVNERQGRMNDIIRNRQEQLSEEFKEGGGDFSVLAPADPPEIVEKESLGELAEETVLAEEATEKQEEAPKKIKIKVDGQEMEVELQAVIDAGTKTLQKETAADKRLQEAARLRQEAQDVLEAARRPVEQNTQTLPQGGSVVEKLTDDNFISAAKALQYGTEEEAAASIKSLFGKAAPSAQSDDLTFQQVMAMLDFREAGKWATEEYKDIFGDERLKGLFIQEETRLRAAGDTRPHREIYADIGSSLREWKGGLAPAAQPNPSLTRQDRKASVVTIPSAAARMPAPEKPKEPSASEIIEKMRRARHQM